MYWHKKLEKWRATCKVGGTWTHLGYFSSEDAAARRFDEAASAQGLPLNFPLRPGDPAAPRGGGRGVSAYTGVYRRKDKWQAAIQIDGKSVHLGVFADESDAARKYDEAAARFGRPLNNPPPAGAAVRVSGVESGATASGASAPPETPPGVHSVVATLRPLAPKATTPIHPAEDPPAVKRQRLAPAALVDAGAGAPVEPLNPGGRSECGAAQRPKGAPRMACAV